MLNRLLAFLFKWRDPNLDSTNEMMRRVLSKEA